MSVTFRLANTVVRFGTTSKNLQYLPWLRLVYLTFPVSK